MAGFLVTWFISILDNKQSSDIREGEMFEVKKTYSDFEILSHMSEMRNL